MRPQTSDKERTKQARPHPRAAFATTRRDGMTDAAERVLGEILEEHGITTAAAATEALRHLCSASAEQLRLADALEAAARRHRLAAQELRNGIDALLSGWGIEVSRAYGPGPATDAKPGWLRRLFTRHNTTLARPPLLLSTADFPTAPNPVTRTGLSKPPSDADPDVWVWVLGPFSVTVASQRISRWPSLKSRGLLQYLVLHPGPVRRELLMEMFWPCHSHQSARNNLNVSLHSLRQTLQHQNRHCILYKDGCYLLNSGLVWWIDRDEFLATIRDAHEAERTGGTDQAIHAYMRAVDLYRGPLFDDDSTWEWHLPEQRHLQEIYLQALDQLGELFLCRGDLAKAVQAAERALTTDHCRESAHRLLMRCYAQQQQQHLVSRQLQLCVTTLREELDVAASALTFRLFEELTTGGG